jgi:hypothetical protein
MIMMLNKRREPQGPLAPEEEQLLCDPALDPSAVADLLLTLYRAKLWLRCECGWTMHVRGGHILARNPGQTEPDAEPCSLCLAWPYQRSPSTPREGEGRPREPGLTLIPTGRRRTGSWRNTTDERGSGGPPSMKYGGMFRAMWTVMDQAGLLCLGGPLRAALLWQRVQEALALTLLNADDPDGLTYADLAWTPTTERTPEEVLSHVASRWQYRDVQAQVWLLAIVDEIPRAQDGRLRLTLDGELHRVEVDLPARNRSVIQGTGPLFLLIQGTHAAGGGVQWDKLAAQPIFSTECPVPVDSSHERDALGVIQELGFRVFKPVLPYVDQLKPDFMLLDILVAVEVMGMHTEGYDEHKDGVMEQMRTHPAFRGWRVLTYRPNRAESLAQFRAKLRAWWRPSAPELAS